MTLSNAGMDTVTNYFLRGQDSLPADLHYALFTTIGNQADGTGFVESPGTDYARIPVTRNTGNFTSPTNGGDSANVNAIVYVASVTVADMGSLVGAGIYSAATGGSVLDSFTFPAPRTYIVGDTIEIPIGEFTFTVTTT